MQTLRDSIDRVDEALLELLRERRALVEEVGRLKRATGMSVRQPERAARLFEARRARAAELDLNPDFVQQLWEAIHEESCRLQGEVS